MLNSCALKNTNVISSVTDNKFLVRRLSLGDRDAFNYIFSTYYPGLVIFANEFIQDKDSAEDIVQGFFVKFWTDRGNIHIESSLKSYLLKSVQNRCLDFLKHKKIKNNYYIKIQNEMRNEIDYSETIILTYELKEKIEISINSLPGNCKEIFIMSRYENKK